MFLEHRLKKVSCFECHRSLSFQVKFKCTV